METATAVAVMNTTLVIPNSTTTTQMGLDIGHSTIHIRQEENFLPTCRQDRASTARDIIDLIQS